MALVNELGQEPIDMENEASHAHENWDKSVVDITDDVERIVQKWEKKDKIKIIKEILDEYMAKLEKEGEQREINPKIEDMLRELGLLE